MAKLGFGDKALELADMINPINHSLTEDLVRKYRVEPYVMVADIYSNPNQNGVGGWTWYTGSSGWYYSAIIEYILGLKIKDKYLTIDPCISKDWKEYEIHYKYKSSQYNIKVKNNNNKNKGVEKFIVNNEEITEKRILLQDNGCIYNIQVIM